MRPCAQSNAGQELPVIPESAMMHMPPQRPYRPIIAMLAPIPVVLFSTIAMARGGAPIVAEWATATSGNWDDDARWSSPTYPDNGFPGAGDRYSAVFGADSATDYTVLLPSALDISLDTLDIDAQGITLLVNGALGTEQGATVRQGRVRVEDGTLSGHWDFRDSNLLIQSGVFRDFTLQHNASSTITLGETMRFEGQNDFGGLQRTILKPGKTSLAFGQGAVLDNLQLKYGLGESLSVDLPSGQGGSFGPGLSITGGDLKYESRDGLLTNHGQLDLETISFSFGANFENRGQLKIGQLQLPTFGAVVNQGILIPGEFNTISGEFVNKIGGQIIIDDGAQANFDGGWFNQGAINVVGGTLRLGESSRGANEGVINVSGDGVLVIDERQSAATVGTINNSSGLVRIEGTLSNHGNTLNLDQPDGQWLLANGRIFGGAVQATSTAGFRVEGGTLSDVQLNATSLSIDRFGLGLDGDTVVNTPSLHFGQNTVLGIYDDASITVDQILGDARFIFGEGVSFEFHEGLVFERSSLRFKGVRSDPTQIVRFASDFEFDRINDGEMIAGQIHLAGDLTLTGNGFNSFEISTGLLLNEGEFRSVGDGRLRFWGGFQNEGEIIVDEGEFDIAYLDRFEGLGDWQVLNGGSVRLNDFIDNSDHVLDVEKYSDSWVYEDVTIFGGTVNAGAGAKIRHERDLILRETTLLGDLQFSGSGDVELFGDVVIDPTGSLTAIGSTIRFAGASATSPLEHATLLLDNGALTIPEDGFTIAESSVIRGDGRVKSSLSPQTLVNEGVIEAVYDQKANQGRPGGLVWSQYLTLDNRGQFLVSGDSRVDVSQPFSSQTASVHNAGLIATSGFGELIIEEFENDGIVNINGGLFALTDQWSNDGSINLLDGEFRLNLDSLDQLNGITRSGGLLTLTGELDLAGQVFDLDTLSGHWRLEAGRISNGGINTSSESMLSADETVFDSVLVDGRLTLGEDETATVVGTTHFTDGINLAADGARLFIEGPWTLADSVLSVSHDRAFLGWELGASLSIEENAELRYSTSGVPMEQTSPVTGIADHRGNTGILNGGLISVIGGGTASVNNVYLYPELQNTGSIVISDGGELEIRSLVSNSGEIAVTDGALEINRFAELRGTISATRSTGIIYGAFGNDPFTANINLIDSALTIDGFWDSDGEIDLTRSTLELTGFYGGSSIDSIQYDSESSIVLGGEIQNSGEHFVLNSSAGQWSIDYANIVGGIMTLVSDEPTPVIGLLLSGGAIVEGDMALLHSNSGIGLEENSQIRGEVVLSGSLAEVAVDDVASLSGMHLVSAYDAAGAAVSARYPSLSLVGQSLQPGERELVLEDDSSISGANLMINSRAISIGSPPLLMNKGLIHSNVANTEILIQSFVRPDHPAPSERAGRDRDRLDPASGTNTPRTNPFEFMNEGVIRASNGGSIIVRDGLAFRNIIDSALTGGSYIVEDASTIDFGSGGEVDINNASITISGPTANLPSIAGLNQNGGDFNLLDGHRFETVGDFDNVGALAIDSASFLKVNGIFEQGGDATLQLSIGDDKIAKKGLLRSSGGLVLGGDLEIAVEEGAVLTPGATWKILTSKGGRTGEFASLIAPDLGPHLGFEILYTGKGVTLLVIPSPSAVLPLVMFTLGAGARRDRRCA